MSLKHKGIEGMLWTFGQQFGIQITQFIVQIVLARVLVPEIFGLIGLISVFISVGNSLVDSGMSSSLVRTRNPDERDYSSVFFSSLIVSIVVYFVLLFSSRQIAIFFNQPILEDIIKVYCLTFIIRALSSVHYVRLTILMDFKKQALLRLPAVAISSVVGLALAFKGYGVWSLIFMQMVNVTLESILIWFQVKWTPLLVFDWNKFKHHFDFGYKLTLSGIIDTIYSNIYNIIIGKFFSVTLLGYYTRADAMKQLPANNISSALKKVTYPLFSSIQEDDVRLKNVYKIVMQQVLFWIAPIMVIAAVLAEPLFRFLLTERWLPAAPYFQVLCLSGIIHPLHAYNLNILNVKGRSNFFLKLEIVKKAITTVGLVIAIPLGIYGLLWLQFIITILSFFINSYYSGEMINYPSKEQLKDILPIFFLTGFVGLLVYFCDIQFPNSSNYDLLRLLTGTILGLVSYLVISALIRFSPLMTFKQIIQR